MASGTEKKRPRRTFWYTLTRLLSMLAMPLFFPIRYHNTELVRDRPGPYMLVSNHVSMLDPIVLAVPIRRHEIRFMGKRELRVNRLFAYILEKLHMISVARHMSDMAAMRAANGALKEGQVLGIFPEGTRTPYDKLMQGVESGFALIALRNRVPVMPAYIHGRPRPFRLTHVYFLPELPCGPIAEKGPGKEACDELIALLREKMLEAREKAEK